MPSKQKNVLVPKLFAANMWAIFNFGDPNQRYQHFLSKGRPAFKLLIEGILLHDKIIVPTQDFMSLTVLLGVLGEHAVNDLIDGECLRFQRVKGSLGYAGNGGGIQPFAISKPGGAHLAFSAPAEEAIAWAIDGLNEKPTSPSLLNKVLSVTDELNLDDSIVGKIRHETYSDILKSENLRNTFALRSTDMNHLAGIEPKGLRIYGGETTDWKGDEIDLVMALASTNLEMYLAQIAGCTDAATASPIGHLLNAKESRIHKQVPSISPFMELREIAGVPDIGEGVLEKQISISDLLKLRQSRTGEQFRVWFHEHCRENIKETARSYIDLLHEVPIVQKLPVRLVRFIATNLVGLIPGLGNVLGVGASAIDSFLIDRWCRGHSPKFFIEDLRQMNGRQARKTGG